MNNEKINIAVVTVSDRASSGVYEDKGGPEVRRYIKEAIINECHFEMKIVSDDRGILEKTLIECADEFNASLIITTGGTGPAPRDITPEATQAVCEKILPGFGERMRNVSVEKVPTAILSRQVTGIRKKSLIINLPGSPKAIKECLDAVFQAVPDCIDLIGGPYVDTNPDIVKSVHHHK